MKAISNVPALPDRPADGHKGTFGTLALLAGNHGMLGAAILAARGALRGGVGLCRACLPEDLMAPFTVAVPAATTVRRPASLAASRLASMAPALEEFFEASSAAVVGPGLGFEPGAVGGTRKMVLTALEHTPGAVVVDADGLNALAPLIEPLRSRTSIVLTPHPGEAARLLGKSTREVAEDRAGAAEELVESVGRPRDGGSRVVVLKGMETLVTDGTRMFRNTTGNSGMGTGGAGDVLAGLVGALLCQGMDPFDASCLAVHLHGKAGDLVASRLSTYGLCAEDLPLAIAEVMR